MFKLYRKLWAFYETIGITANNTILRRGDDGAYHKVGLKGQIIGRLLTSAYFGSAYALGTTLARRKGYKEGLIDGEIEGRLPAYEKGYNDALKMVRDANPDVNIVAPYRLGAQP